MKPRVFIASSSENLQVAYAVQEGLQKDADATVWDQGTFEPSQPAIEGLLRAVETTDFAILVFAPDDIVRIRNASRMTPRDNVVFECGLFIGGLGRDRTFFVIPSGHELRLPSDLLGLIAPTYDATRTDLLASLGPACNQIRRMLKLRGTRESRKAALVQTQRDVYAYVFNRLNPYSDVSLTQDFLRNLPHAHFARIDDVLYPLDSLIHHYVPHLIDDSLRVYFAYRLASPISAPTSGDPLSTIQAYYRFGISFSRRTDRWYEGLPVGVPSNIHRAYSRKGISRVRNAREHLNTSGAENQRVDDEGSVIAVPVLYGDDDGNSECVGVIGISSPHEDEATKPEMESLAHELGILFSALFYAYGRYLQKNQAFEAVVQQLRSEVADHFESKFDLRSPIA